MLSLLVLITPLSLSLWRGARTDAFKKNGYEGQAVETEKSWRRLEITLPYSAVFVRKGLCVGGPAGLMRTYPPFLSFFHLSGSKQFFPFFQEKRGQLDLGVRVNNPRKPQGGHI